MIEPHHQAYCRYLEDLTTERLDRLTDYVAADVRFRDPFNDTRGADAMAGVFRHMFDSLRDVRFRVLHAAASGETCLLSWRFDALLGARAWSFDGTSVVRFGADGRVLEHVDHWDAAREFYERLPVIGWLLRGLRRRIAVY